MSNEGKLKTIIGYVGETEDDDAVRLTILSDEEDYIVEMNKQGKKLLQALDCEVRASGRIQRNRDGGNMIAITKFEIIDDDYEDYEDDEDDDDSYDDDNGNDDDDVYGDDRGDRDDWIE